MQAGSLLTRRNAVFGGLCVCCASARAGRAGAIGPASVTEVVPGIFIRNGAVQDASPANNDAIANIGFITGQNAVAVLDPGGCLQDGHSLRRAIRRHTALPIKYVILSHVHPDHIFGAGAFVDDKPAFIGHERLPAALAARGAFYGKGLDEILGAGRAGPVIPPTMLVRGQRRIDLGGRALTLTAHPPAHTDCDLSVVDAQTGTLLTGDLLFVDRVPSLDGDLEGWLEQLAILRVCGATHAVPGHGPNLVAWPGAAAPLEFYLRTIQTQVRQAIANAVPIERAAGSVGLSERGKWRLFDDYNPRNVLEAYRQLEWE